MWYSFFEIDSLIYLIFRLDIFMNELVIQNFFFILKFWIEICINIISMLSIIDPYKWCNKYRTIWIKIGVYDIVCIMKILNLVFNYYLFPIDINIDLVYLYHLPLELILENREDQPKCTCLLKSIMENEIIFGSGNKPSKMTCKTVYDSLLM